MLNTTLWRGVSILLGVIAAGLDAYGAFSLTKQAEGGSITYLVVAAPTIAMATVLIPPTAEACWKEGARIKAALWWIAFIPAATTAFYATAERWHLSEAGAEAERAAYKSAAARAKEKLEELRPKAEKAKEEADKTAGWKVCNTNCERVRAKAARLKAEVEEAEAKLLKAEAAVIEESPLKAPAWLLPLSLAVISFMALWSGFSGPPIEKAVVETKNWTKRKVKSKRRRRLSIPSNRSFAKPRLVVANDNIWTPPAA